MSSSLGVLQSAKKVDRLKYQIKLIFQQFDADGDGRLSPVELRAYLDYSLQQLGGPAASPPEVLAAVAAVQDAPASPAQTEPSSSSSSTPTTTDTTATSSSAAATASPPPARESQPQASESDASGGSSSSSSSAVDASAWCTTNGFEDLVRGHIAAASTHKPFVVKALPGAEAGRLQYKAAITEAELGSALAVFKLLDFNGDGYVALMDLRRAQGIEREMVSNVLEEADANDDGFLSFEDWLNSYKKVRPVWLTMAILAANCACFYLLLNSPIDTLYKAVGCVALLALPKLVNAPVIKVYNIAKSLYDRMRATVHIAQQDPEDEGAGNGKGNKFQFGG
ncbi:MAG: hypothetical protein WDW38_007389 [Sanguina aurantia]